jgi:pyruvate dehydrogenase phosphatase
MVTLVCKYVDGHSGTECSAVLESYLSAYVAKEIMNLPPANSKEERIKSVSLAIQNAFTRLDSDILEGRITSIDMPSSSWFSWWTNQKVDTALIVKNLRNAMAGSCALLAYLEGKQLYVACTGDSRAVLGTRGLDGSFSALEMSVDQTTKNSKEYNRIMQGIQVF